MSFTPLKGVYGPRTCLGRKLLESDDFLCFISSKYDKLSVQWVGSRVLTIQELEWSVLAKNTSVCSWCSWWNLKIYKMEWFHGWNHVRLLVHARYQLVKTISLRVLKIGDEDRDDTWEDLGQMEGRNEQMATISPYRQEFTAHMDFTVVNSNVVVVNSWCWWFRLDHCLVVLVGTS